MTPPVSWIEQDPRPVPGDACFWCGRTHAGHDDAACAHWTDPDDVCPVCHGCGVLGDVRRSDYQGRRCNACAGQGYVESHYEQGEEA